MGVASDAAHCGAGPRQREAVRARPLARLGAAAFGRVRLPDLEDAAETHEHHGSVKSGMSYQDLGRTMRPSLSASTGNASEYRAAARSSCS